MLLDWVMPSLIAFFFFIVSGRDHQIIMACDFGGVCVRGTRPTDAPHFCISSPVELWESEGKIDYLIEVIIVDSNSQKLELGSEQYNYVIDLLKNHLSFVRDNVHANFKIFHNPIITTLVFVKPSAESIQKIKEHIHKLNRHDETMSIIFDGLTLKIIKKE